MRSRYTAYVLGDTAYLLATWHPDTRPGDFDATDPAVKWIGLQVVAVRDRSTDRGEVEFVARYRIGGKAHRLHETSQFERIGARWFYRDGDVREPGGGPGEVSPL